jgi:hypothetical protein
MEKKRRKRRHGHATIGYSRFYVFANGSIELSSGIRWKSLVTAIPRQANACQAQYRRRQHKAEWQIAKGIVQPAWDR